MTDNCYVCLEECEHRSPCNCSHAVHVKCLEEVKADVSSTRCTICRCNFDGVLEEPDPETESKAPSKCCRFVQGFVVFWFVYLVSGVGGQLLLAIVGRPGILFQQVSFVHTIFSINFIGSCWIMLFPIICVAILCRITPSTRF